MGQQIDLSQINGANGFINIAHLLSANTTTYAQGAIVLASANQNFNNSASINCLATANGTQANVSFVVNTSLALTSLNVTTLNVTTMNANGVLSANASPLTNTQTRVLTGMVKFMTANTSCTSSTALRAEANLTMQVNESGVYEYRASWFVLSQNANNIGSFQFTVNGGGTANINMGALSILSTNNRGLAITSGDQEAFWGSAQFTPASVYGLFPLSTTAGLPDFIWMAGVLTINNTGTICPTWSQSVSAANATLLLANSYVMLTKIG